MFLLLANSHARVWLEVCLGVPEAAELLSNAMPTFHLVPLQAFFFFQRDHIYLFIFPCRRLLRFSCRLILLSTDLGAEAGVLNSSSEH